MSYVDLDRYQKYLAGCIAHRELKNKFPNVYEKKSNLFTIIMGGRLEYGRGGPKFETTLKALKNVNIISTFNKRDVNVGYRFNMKSDYRYFLEVRPEWYNEYIKTHEEYPEFETKKEVYTARYLSGGKKVASDIDSYKNLNSFKDIEYIYLLKHFDDFHFLENEYTTRSTRFYSRRTHKEILCYPKDKRNDLSKEIFYNHLEVYLNKHFEWAVQLVLGIDENVINKEHPHLSSYVAQISEYDNWKPDYFKRKIEETKTGIEYLQRVLPVLEQIHDRLLETEPIKEKAIEAFRKYLEECFPCHIEDEDTELKKLAQWMLRGKHMGKVIHDN